MKWYLMAWQRCLQFSGRSRRTEYWMFFLINILVAIAIALMDLMLGTVDEQTHTGTFSTLYSFIVILPTLALTVRRLHDTGRTGWWVLISLIPVLGVIVLLVFMALDGEPGGNHYGASPKGGMAF
ncbi:DUF805 domain-containing protein [Ferrimonas futtsuensis]|uniref:DUF805 domain-containing protein n=1 Tax=Ferrimonas futtsuensis TaxID=364764 RepID=UPI000487B26F|nr:DUF805 domain-containing protein [Ferrimonas futtsuensis]